MRRQAGWRASLRCRLDLPMMAAGRGDVSSSGRAGWVAIPSALAGRVRIDGVHASQIDEYAAGNRVNGNSLRNGRSAHHGDHASYTSMPRRFGVRREECQGTSGTARGRS